jgi:hypothetical protein
METTDRDLGRVEGKLDMVLERLDAIDARHSALEPRVRKLEGKLLYFSGAAMALAIFIGKVDFTKVIAVASAAAMH